MEDALKTLLGLQDCDRHATQCAHELQELGRDLERIKERRQGVLDAREVAQAAFLKKEAHQRTIASELEQEEATLIERKARQAQLKKAEEHAALGEEIKAKMKHMDALEDEELVLLEELDEDKKVLAQQDKEVESKLKELEQTEKALKERITHQEGQLEKAKDLLGKVRAQVDAKSLEDYERVKVMTRGRFPLVCHLEGEYCKGCHLKVSKEIISQIFQGKERVHCDQCGRILYVSH